MNELINGRTPEEIKRDIKRCSEATGCTGCEHIHNIECVEDNMINALALIEHYEQRIEKQNALLAVMGITILEDKLKVWVKEAE